MEEQKKATISQFRDFTLLTKGMSLKQKELYFKDNNHNIITGMEHSGSEWIQVEGIYFDYVFEEDENKSTIKKYNGEYITLSEFIDTDYKDLIKY